MKLQILSCAFLVAGAGVAVADEPKPSTDLQPLAGVWVFDRLDVSTRGNESNDAGRVWMSTVTITGDAFALSRPMFLSKRITGKFAFNPAAGPNAVDLKLDEFDLAAAGAPVQLKISAGTLPGLYRLQGDRLEVTFASEPGMKRPKDFDTHADKVFRARLVKAPASFKEFPKRVTLRVNGPDGKPAAGVTATRHMWFRSARPDDINAPTGWQYVDEKKTDAEGKVVVAYDDPVMLARHAERKQMAFV